MAIIIFAIRLFAEYQKSYEKYDINKSTDFKHNNDNQYLYGCVLDVRVNKKNERKP